MPLKSAFARIFVLLVAAAATLLPAMAEGEDTTPTGRFEASLLTCAPGTAVYELYGHTALRLRNVDDGEDWVFNFGMFDFRRPNFVWRFVLGQTDYYLGAMPFESFVRSYLKQGRGIEEQHLDLRPEETERLWRHLAYTNALKGWTYRYNFLYDNCTTRAVESIEQAIDGHIEWPAIDSARTFRTIIHEFAAEASPWNRFGQDLLLGSDVDKPTDVRDQLFSPVYAADLMDGAVIVDAAGGRRPLVTGRHAVLPVRPEATESLWLTPMRAAVLLLVVVVGLSLWERRRGKALRWPDYPLMLLAGSAGCIVTLLFCCSEHPAVGSNWLIVLLNPLPLLYIPVKWRRERGGRTDGAYHKGVLVALAVFAGCSCVSPQRFPAELYALALILLIRSANVLSLLQKSGRRTTHTHHIYNKEHKPLEPKQTDNGHSQK